jgi:hypothetical protein
MRRFAPLLVVLAGAALALPAAATASPVPTGAISMGITTAASGRSVWAFPEVDCISLDGGWNPFGGNQWTGTSFRPRGLLDVPARRGEVFLPGQAIHIERIFVHPPRALGALDVGLQLAGRGGYLTGRIAPVRATSVRVAARRRLARLRRVSIVSRASHGHLLVTAKGRATMLPPLAGTLDRMRCKGPRDRTKPIRSGQVLGRVTAAIDPARAIATAGTLTATVSVLGSAYSGPTVEPTGGVGQTSGGLRFPWAPGTHVPAACSQVCVPDGGTVGLVGGFDLVQGTTRLSFTDLSLAASPGPRFTISATVAGARHAIASGDMRAIAFTADGNALLAQAFADPAMTGAFAQPLFAPTALGPA